MIVDDSLVARAVLSRMIEADGGFEIAAVAGTAEEAIDTLRSVRVDIILLDLEMPGAGGLRSIPRILDVAAGASIMIVSSVAEDGAEETVTALALGASDALPKPGTGRFNGTFSEVLLARLRALGPADRGRAAPSPAPAAAPTPTGPLRAMAPTPASVIAIGASTGGIHALSSFFAELPARAGVPILVTQHLPVPFIPVFARQLAIAARRETLVAQDGMALLADRILLAPGDAHLTVREGPRGPVVALDRTRVASGCMPSLDPMFASVAQIFRDGAYAVVLTGMGRDGVVGATRLAAAGGSVLAQDEASSAVWGMPRAVLDAGIACAALPPEKLARRIAGRLGDLPCK